MICQAVTACRPVPLRILTLTCLTLLLALAARSASAEKRSSAPKRASVATASWLPGWLPGDPEPAVIAAPAPLWAKPMRHKAHAPGLLIAIDPVTRRPTKPTAEQIRAFEEQQARDPLLAPERPLTAERLPGGGEILHLGGAFQVYSIARRDANGRIVTDCSADPDALAKPARQREVK